MFWWMPFRLYLNPVPTERSHTMAELPHSPIWLPLLINSEDFTIHIWQVLRKLNSPQLPTHAFPSSVNPGGDLPNDF